MSLYLFQYQNEYISKVKFGIFITFGIISSNHFVNILVILPQTTQYCDIWPKYPCLSLKIISQFIHFSLFQTFVNRILLALRGKGMDFIKKNHKIVLFDVKSQEYWKIIYRNSSKYDEVSNCHFRNGSIVILE